MDDSLAAITARLVQFREERGWEAHHTPKNLALSVSIEAGELLELFQWSERRSHLSATAEKDAVADEIADVMIYLLNLAGVLGIDPAEAVWSKIERNAERYPVL